MSGKRLILVFFGLLVATLGFIFWIGATGGGTANHPSQQAASVSPSSSAASAASAASGSRLVPPSKHVVDKRVRDELRQRILAGWAQEGASDEETRTAARAGRFVPLPDRDGRGIDPAYVEAVIREDMRPMARQCYENLLAKQPDAGGRLELELTIVGDDKIGGIVETAGIAETSTLKDDELQTCIRESAMTLSFPPPAHDGVVTIKAPITFVHVEPDR